jgi:hypothetical protein
MEPLKTPAGQTREQGKKVWMNKDWKHAAPKGKPAKVFKKTPLWVL